MHNPIKNHSKKIVFILISIALTFIVACGSTTADNQKPIAKDLELTVESGQEKSVALDASDADGDNLSFEITEASHGTASLQNDDSVSYTSDADFVGTDSFGYRAFDGKAYSNMAVIEVLVSSYLQNSLPVVSPVAVTTQTGQAVTVSFSGSDGDNDSFSYEVVTQPRQGSLSAVNINKVVYTPNNGYVGQDSFTYAARDAEGLGTSATVQISITQTTTANTAPQISNQTFSVLENKAANTLLGTIAANDAQDTSLNFEIVGGNSVGMFALNATTGQLRLAKAPNFEAQSSYPLQVKVSDSGGLSKTATVTVQVMNVDYGKVIFIGDSITRGWGSVGGTGWPLKVRNALNTSFSGDFTTENKGVDGDTVIGLKNRLAAQVTGQNPKFVTVQIGTNDVYNNSGVAPASATVAAFEAQVAAVLQSLKATASIEQVFVLGIIAPVKSGADVTFPGLISTTQAVLDGNVVAYNAALNRQATARGFVFIDLAAQFPADASARLPWIPDGVHPSEAGYNLIGNSVEAQLKTKFN